LICWQGARDPPWLRARGDFSFERSSRSGFPALHFRRAHSRSRAGISSMAHQFSSGVFCYNKPAWHRLGVVVDGTLSAREAFRVANADFHVAGRPVFDADMQPIAGYQAITRMDTGRTLSVMTETYTPIQNESLIRIAEALHEDINMDAVCVLSDGKKVTFTARIRGAEGDVVPGDPVQQYLIGCTSHDGSIPFQLLFSPIRVVCQNTLSAALGLASNQRHQYNSIRIRHTKNADSLIQRLPDLVDVRRRQFIGGLDELRHMAATPCSMAQFRQYISNIFADQLQGTVNDVRGDKSTERPKVLEDLAAWSSVLLKFEGEAIGSDLSASSGTAWGAYQAVTEYISHDSGRAKNPLNAARKRLESIYWGSASDQLTKAHEFALTI
jgi:phage/plasmid-like protein (TIGR03299 family)